MTNLFCAVSFITPPNKEDLVPAIEELSGNLSLTVQLLRPTHPTIQQRNLGFTANRKLISVCYTDWVSNNQLYNRTETVLVRYVLLRNRWRLLGHILRRPANIPAYCFMDAYIKTSDTCTYRGRRLLILPMVLDADLQTLSTRHLLQRALKLYLLRLCAQDRKGWKQFIDGLLAQAPIERL
ncbi:Hypothetical protein PHPALM_3550 [Phytophthora palmivora]|uniref:Uncharacterized protein n=1 Tax=Phytophthora palmivora TaxID=4796 RepID=A0A2P4YM44_9STRA|nr:Hypothetical protein PHPALM_3550 [Phytophthora palmivora]